MINNIIKNGLKKSIRDVIKGIKKLFGSFPFLNNKIELINIMKKIIINITITVKIIIIITSNKLISSSPVEYAII